MDHIKFKTIKQAAERMENISLIKKYTTKIYQNADCEYQLD